jgi:hypothetical protein
MNQQTKGVNKMRKMLATAVGTLFLATVGLVAASMAIAHADTGINYTFGPVTYSCNPCTGTSAKTTTTITSGGQTQTLSTNATTQRLYVKNTTTTASGTTTNNFYAGDLGLWAGQNGVQSGYWAPDTFKLGTNTFDLGTPTPTPTP